MREIYGYVRVSSRDQNEDRQLITMKEMNVPEKNIYIDKQSGKDFDRRRGESPSQTAEDAGRRL